MRKFLPDKLSKRFYAVLTLSALLTFGFISKGYAEPDLLIKAVVKSAKDPMDVHINQVTFEYGIYSKIIHPDQEAEKLEPNLSKSELKRRASGAYIINATNHWIYNVPFDFHIYPNMFGGTINSKVYNEGYIETNGHVPQASIILPVDLRYNAHGGEPERYLDYMESGIAYAFKDLFVPGPKYKDISSSKLFMPFDKDFLLGSHAKLPADSDKVLKHFRFNRIYASKEISEQWERYMVHMLILNKAVASEGDLGGRAIHLTAKGVRRGITFPLESPSSEFLNRGDMHILKKVFDLEREYDDHLTVDLVRLIFESMKYYELNKVDWKEQLLTLELIGFVTQNSGLRQYLDKELELYKSFRGEDLVTEDLIEGPLSDTKIENDFPGETGQGIAMERNEKVIEKLKGDAEQLRQEVVTKLEAFLAYADTLGEALDYIQKVYAEEISDSIAMRIFDAAYSKAEREITEEQARRYGVSREQLAGEYGTIFAVLDYISSEKNTKELTKK